MKFLAARLEILVGLAFLWVTAGVLWPPVSYFSKTVTALDASDPFSAAAHALFIALLVVVAVLRPGETARGLRYAWPVLPLLALAYVSAFWSEAPELVLRRATTLAATTLFAVYLAWRFEIGRLVAVLVGFNAAAAFGSFVVAAIAHPLAVGGSIDYPTAWRGVYTAKNTLGGMSAFGILLAVYALRHGYGSRLVAVAVIPANLLLLYLSQSATPLLLLLAAAYVAAMAGAFRRRSAAGFALGAGLAMAGLLGLGLLAIGWADLLTALGRSATLTGRTRIWRLSLDNIALRPWLGYGFGAFWRHGEVEARNVWQMLYWTVPHAHNLWLEIGLGLGIVGMTGITLLWLGAFARAVRVLTRPAAEHAVFCLALLTAILVENFSEYEFLRPDSLYWALFVGAFTYLGREAATAAAARHAARPPAAIAAAAPFQR